MAQHSARAYLPPDRRGTHACVGQAGLDGVDDAPGASLRRRPAGAPHPHRHRPLAACVDTSHAAVAALAELIPADDDIALLEPAPPEPAPGVALAATTLGRLVGIRDDGKLVAMAGERLQIADYIEISGVCTHPDHRGRGYGAALMRTVGARIIADDETPFLHPYANNSSAIALNQSLGFETRCEVTHAVWKRA